MRWLLEILYTVVDVFVHDSSDFGSAITSIECNTIMVSNPMKYTASLNLPKNEAKQNFGVQNCEPSYQNTAILPY